MKARENFDLRPMNYRLLMAEKSPKIPSSLIGAAGEHFVMFELYRRGIMVGQPPQGVPDIDLLVLDEAAQVLKNLQVKTRSKGADGGWHMKLEHEKLISPRLFYVFVDMAPESPIVYVIPSKVVAQVVSRSYATWLAIPGKGGRPHSQTDMRRILPSYSFKVAGFPDGWMDTYKDRWDLLCEP